MGYKVLGFIVWRAGKWYVRRRFSDSGRTLAFAGAAAAAAAGVGLALAGRRRARAAR